MDVRSEIRKVILAWWKPAVYEEERCRVALNKAFKERWKIEDCELYELIHERHNEPEDPSEPNFIVWLDMQLDVDWLFTQNLDKEAEDLVTQAEAVQARRCKHLPLQQIVEFKRIVGHGVVSGIRGSKAATQKLIKEAEQFLKDRTIERSRIWTLWFSHLVFSLLMLSVLAVMRHFPVRDLTMVITSGGGLLGAYLSIIQNAGNGKWDAAAGKGAHFVEVGTKSVAGIIAGLIVFVLSRSVHAPDSIKALTADEYSQFFLGFVAGFSERLIPKIIASYSPKDLPKD